MVEETEANWRDCIRKTIDLSPDSVTIYQMEIPYNTTIYKEMKAEGRLVAPVADWEQKRDWVDEAFAELERVGYTVASAYTAVKDKTKTRFVYRDKFWAGADLLALGRREFRPHRRDALSKPPRLRTVRQCGERGQAAGLSRTNADRR